MAIEDVQSAEFYSVRLSRLVWALGAIPDSWIYLYHRHDPSQRLLLRDWRHFIASGKLWGYNPV